MKKTLYTVLAAALLVACGGNGQLVKDPQTRKSVEANVEARSAWLPALPEGIMPREKEGLQFLYAYMPVSDAADY